jgi:hypothetical protein
MVTTKYLAKFQSPTAVRDRPFNLQGGYGFLFRSKKKCSDNTRVRIFFFPQNLTLGYMTNILISDYFFFLHQNQNIFFINIGKLNDPSLSWPKIINTNEFQVYL